MFKLLPFRPWVCYLSIFTAS